MVGGDLGSGGQDLVEVTAPLRRVLAGAQSPGLGRRQHAFDPAPHPARRLRLGGPERLDHFQHESRVDVGHGDVAQDGVGVDGERIAPLLPVFGVLPARLIGGNELLGAFPEGCPARLCEPLLGRRSVPNGDGVFVRVPELPGLLRLLSGICEGRGGVAPSPISRALPSRLYRNTQDLLPAGDTCR